MPRDNHDFTTSITITISGIIVIIFSQCNYITDIVVVIKITIKITIVRARRNHAFDRHHGKRNLS